MKRPLNIRGEDLEWREVEGEVVILDLRTSKYLSLNRSGALLWKRLTEGTTEQDLIQTIKERYDLDDETARRDVDNLVQQLKSADLLAS